MVKVLVVAKSVNGGWNTYIDSLQKLDGNEIKISTIILGIGRTTLGSQSYIFYGKSSYHPEKYSFFSIIFFRFAKEIIWYRKQLIRIKPDVVLSIDTHSNLLVLISKCLFFLKYKTILTIHIDPLDTIKEKASIELRILINLLIRYFYNQANLIITVSRRLLESVKKDYVIKNRIITIYNGVKTKPKQKYNTNKELIISSMGRLVKQKDFATIIKAFAKIKLKKPKINLWIIGEGPLKNELIDLTKKLGVAKNVKFWGWVENADSLLGKSNLFVLSSKREGLPYSLLEAMSLGIPVISYDTEFGPSEILDDGKHGVLVNQNDVDSLSNAMSNLITDRKQLLSNSQKAYKRSLYFSEDRMLKKYRKIILNMGF
jgi:glycosyltransferase involved in cell wall biosynthesis